MGREGREKLCGEGREKLELQVKYSLGCQRVVLFLVRW